MESVLKMFKIAEHLSNVGFSSALAPGRCPAKAELA